MAMTQQRYRQIADQLEQEIALMSPGDRLPGEHEIATRFGVGRAAARAAVQELERKQLVRRIRGAGTFVGRRIDYLISRDRRPSWHRTVTEAGATARSVVLGHAAVPVDGEIASFLALPEGTLVHRMERQSYIDELVSGYSVEWVVLDAVPHLADGMRVEESLDEVLRQMGSVRSERSWCRTASDVPPADIAERLQLVTAAAVWVVESLNCDSESRRPLTYSKAWMRGDAVRVVMEIGDRPASTPDPARDRATTNVKEVAHS